MRPYIFVPFLFLFALAAVAADLTEQEELALENRVLRQVAAGKLDALNELAERSPKYCTSAYLMIYKMYPNDRAITARCARLATATPVNEDYLNKLLKAKVTNNATYFQQETAVKCLVFVHNQNSVRILCNSLANVDPNQTGPRVLRGLQDLNLPEAPTTASDKIRYPDALAKWQSWWEEHKGDYAAQ